MKISVDTNVLVRSAIEDDPRQARIARDIMANASIVAIGLVALCEFAWVLRAVYKLPPQRIAAAIRALISSHNVEINPSAVEAGLAMLDAGGDFADGIVAFEGSWLGGETFVSFDKTAVELLAARGHAARLLR